MIYGNIMLTCHIMSYVLWHRTAFRSIFDTFMDLSFHDSGRSVAKRVADEMSCELGTKARKLVV